MKLTPEQQDAAGEYALIVRNAVLPLLASTPGPGELPQDQAILAGIDGLVAAIAAIAALGGVAPTPRDQRRLADEVRTGLIKAMRAVRTEAALVAAGAVANDPR